MEHSIESVSTVPHGGQIKSLGEKRQGLDLYSTSQHSTKGVRSKACGLELSAEPSAPPVNTAPRGSDQKLVG